MMQHRSSGTSMGPLLLIMILMVSTAVAYQPSQQQQQQHQQQQQQRRGLTGNRREYLAGLLTATCAAAVTVSTVLSPVQPANAVLGAGECASGVGEGCGDRSDGNDYIRSLQEKSAVNKDMYEKQTREAYYMKNYPDFFATYGQTLVKKTDGTFMLVDDATLQELKKANKITVEIPKTMGGRVTDLTQKPVLVMRE